MLFFTQSENGRTVPLLSLIKRPLRSLLRFEALVLRHAKKKKSHLRHFTKVPNLLSGP